MRSNGHAIIFLLVAALGCVGCDQKPKHPAVPPPEGEGDQLDADIAWTRETYVAKQPEVADADGFIDRDRCDSSTFTALLGAAGVRVNLRAALDQDGKPLRRPATLDACYPTWSASDNSKDQLVAWLLNGIVTGDVELLEHVLSYGRAHKWIMGRGPISRTFMPTTLRGQYARAIKALGGREHERELTFDQLWTPGLDGFEAHLQVISILAYGRTFGGITEVGLQRLREHTERQPRNPLFAAAYWRYSGDGSARERARAVLADVTLFPRDRLPTSADRCEAWLTQRDEIVPVYRESTQVFVDRSGAARVVNTVEVVGTKINDDWLPCPDQGRTHSGGDFLLADAVLYGKI